MVVKQYRKHPSRAAVTRSVYLPTELSVRVEQEAMEEGHNNFSTVVVKALNEHFERRETQEQGAA